MCSAPPVDGTGTRAGWCGGVTIRRHLRRWSGQIAARASAPATLVAVALAGLASMGLVVVVTAPPALAASAPTTSAGSTSGPSWSTASPRTSPPARSNAAMAYDGATNQVVLFGGRSASGKALGDTWLWDGSSWHQASPNQSPSPRQGAAMAYNAKRGELILFGGSSGSGAQNDTWAWNGATWVPIPCPTTGSQTCVLPPARSDAALAADGDGFVLFGGAAGGTALGDTWTFDGSTWSQPSPATSPPARAEAAMTYDAARSEVVMFGGQSSPGGGGWLGDTWVWNGTTWKGAPATTSPSARAGAVLAYDGDLGSDVLATGQGANGTLSDTWSFDGRNWSQLSPSGQIPARSQAAGTWDAADHRMVLFGGADDTGKAYADTYLLAPPTPSPAPSSTTTTSPASTTSADPTSTSAAVSSSTTANTSTSTSTSPSSTSTTTAPSHPPTTSPTTSVPSSPSVVADPSPRPALAAAGTVHRGQAVTLSGSGFAPGALVTLSFHSTPVLLGAVRANSAGDFAARVTVPGKAVTGGHHFEASGMDQAGSVVILTSAVQVLQPPTHGRPLYETLAMVALAVLIPVVTWAVMGLAGRRRRHRAQPTH